MSATLMLDRQGFGLELRRGLFEVSVDGNRAGSLEYGETFEVPLEPGDHTLQISAGRYASRERRFGARDGEVINFRCHGAMAWPRYLASLVSPGLAISLKRG